MIRPIERSYFGDKIDGVYSMCVTVVSEVVPAFVRFNQRDETLSCIND